MSTTRLDVVALAANWRGLLAVLEPQLSAAQLDDLATTTVASITAQSSPATWRAIGEAFLIELHIATTERPGAWRLGVTHDHMLRALIALQLLDRAFTVAVAGGSP